MATPSKNNQTKASFWVKITRSMGRHRLQTSLIGAAVIVLLGGGIVAAKANASKPGDALYSVDTALEKIRLALAFSNSMKATVHQNIAKERLTEIQDLLKEKNPDASGIATALANFEKEKQSALVTAKGTEKENEVDNELKSLTSQIDKLFEAQQATIEKQRESLKKQAEAAEKAGNTTLATQLRAQADALDAQLKTLETKREASKTEQEKFSDTLKTETQKVEDNAAQQDLEAQKEAVQQQQESLQNAVEQEVQAQTEAAQKLQEQQQEQSKQQQEQQQEQSKQQQEQQQETTTETNQ